MGDLLSCPQHGLHLLGKREQRPDGDQREGERVRRVRGRPADIGGGAAYRSMVPVGEEQNKVAVTTDREHPIDP